jgi:hypothetical protein
MHKQSNETQFERETTFGVYPISLLHEQNRREWFSGYQSAMRGEGPPCSLTALRGYATFNENAQGPSWRDPTLPRQGYAGSLEPPTQ